MTIRSYPNGEDTRDIFDWENMTIRSYPNGEDTRDIFDWENMTVRSYPTGEDPKGIFDQTARFVSFGQWREIVRGGGKCAFLV